MNLAYARFISDNIDSGRRDVKHPPAGVGRRHLIAAEVIDAGSGRSINALTLNTIPIIGGG